MDVNTLAKFSVFLMGWGLAFSLFVCIIGLLVAAFSAKPVGPYSGGVLTKSLSIGVAVIGIGIIFFIAALAGGFR